MKAGNEAESDVDQDANGGNAGALNNSEDDNTSVGGDAENNCGVRAGGCQSADGGDGGRGGDADSGRGGDTSSDSGNAGNGGNGGAGGAGR